MKITEQQLLLLFDIAKGSLNIIGQIGMLYQDQRRALVNDIIKQQGKYLIDVKSE